MSLLNLIRIGLRSQQVKVKVMNLLDLVLNLALLGARTFLGTQTFLWLSGLVVLEHLRGSPAMLGTRTFVRLSGHVRCLDLCMTIGPCQVLGPLRGTRAMLELGIVASGSCAGIRA